MYIYIYIVNYSLYISLDILADIAELTSNRI